MKEEETAGGLYATPSLITQLQKNKPPIINRENKGREVGGSYTAPIDNTAAEKKRIPPTGGETNQNGGGYHPHQ